MNELTAAQIKALDEALRDRRILASRSRYELHIGDDDYSHLLKSHTYSCGDGPAMVLTAVIAARLDESLEGKGVRFEQVINGTPYRVFTGEAIDLDTDTDVGYTTLSAASASTQLEGTPLPPTITEFNNADPRTALFEVLSVLMGPAGYSNIDIAPKPEGVFTRLASKSEGYYWTDRLSGVAENIREDTGLTFFDDGNSQAVGYLEDSLTRPEEPLIELVAGEDLINYRHSSRYRERYSEVRVYRSVDGIPLPLASAKTGIPGNKPLDIQTEDPSVLAAQDRAFREALAIQTDSRLGEFELLYPLPHVTRVDTLAVTELERGVRRGKPGQWVRRYLFRVTGFSGSETKRMSVSGVQRRVSEEFLEEPRSVPLSASRGAVRAFYGPDYLGRLYFGVAWVRYDPTKGLVFYPDLAAESGVSVTYGAHYGIAIAELGWTPPSPPPDTPTNVRGSDERLLGELGDYTIGALSG